MKKVFTIVVIYLFTSLIPHTFPANSQKLVLYQVSFLSVVGHVIIR